MSGEPPAWADIPAEVRLRVRQRLLNLLSDIGVPAKVDTETGELVVPVAVLAAKLGMTEEDVRAAAGVDGLRTVDPVRMETVQ